MDNIIFFIKRVFVFLCKLVKADLISSMRSSSYVRNNFNIFNKISFMIKFLFDNIKFLWKTSYINIKRQSINKRIYYKSNTYSKINNKNRTYSKYKQTKKNNIIPYILSIFNKKILYTISICAFILSSVFISYGFFMFPPAQIEEINNIDNIQDYNKYSDLSIHIDEQYMNRPENNIIEMEYQNNNLYEYTNNYPIVEEGTSDIIEEGMPVLEEKENSIVEYITYEIKQGDTISELALNYNVTGDAIFTANVNINSKALKIGDTLRIPNQNGFTYKIRRNDTLSSIALLFDTTVDAISEENQLKNSMIHVDTELFITSGKFTEEAKLRILGIELINPVKGRLTSKYGSRIHPINRNRVHHNGIDIGSCDGKTIVAAQSGTVIFSGWNGGYGNHIKIRHRDGLVTTYSHLASRNVKAWQKVKRGQKIGIVGDTGNVTGAHLHFEVLLNGKFVNPRIYVTY